jgi:multidrug resistance efflux pump
MAGRSGEEQAGKEPDMSRAEEQAVQKPPMDPVRKWTFIVLAVCVVLLIWYLVSDRITPYSAQARVHALVVPVAAEVSGTVVNVAVTNNQLVSAGDELFRIDRARYELAVETARASLQSARQAMGASTANVDAAAASLTSARGSLLRAEQDAVRLRRIKEEDPGAISERRLESAEATLVAARGSVAAAAANLQKAREDLGQVGDDNSMVLQAQAALDQALINLEQTSIVAPDDGLVTDVRVDRGNFAQAGAPQMTFIATHNVWVQAAFTENNLGNIKPGDRVGVIFDVLPGRVYEGRVRGAGFGVAVDSAPLGSLPTIDNDRQWLRDAQRFPVLVDFQISEQRARSGLRVGAQAAVIVYTGDNWLFNTLGALYLRIVSFLSYAY